MTKRFLVTGGCGSIGSALVNHLLENNSNIVCSFDNNEDGLFQQQQTLSLEKKKNLKSFIGDVRDFDRLEQAMRGVDYVYHCAALKHVKLCEYNPFEALKTNIDGTNNIVNASLKADVKKVVLTSSDKAVNPSSTMGASKLLSERIIISGNNIRGNKNTKFCSVRFGNVWNTAGSVGKIFKAQILNNQNLTITASEMTRFFVTMKNAIELCEFAMDKMIGGEIFISDMGKLKIKDLADNFIKSYNSKVKLEIIGAHPGEKLYEELYTEQESKRTGKVDKFYLILPETDFLINTNTYWENNKEFKKVTNEIPLRSDTNGKDIDPLYLINQMNEK
tara:strand:- start:459 stop:1457 length:999 start_codon:yes stop_codon:yes gene_type:complete